MAAALQEVGQSCPTQRARRYPANGTGTMLFRQRPSAIKKLRDPTPSFPRTRESSALPRFASAPFRLPASATELTTGRASYFRVSPNSEHGWDNVQLIADGRSTTQTFTYNDANEQLTSTINGVTTDMTYDEWGRLEERDDGTHTAITSSRFAVTGAVFTGDRVSPMP